MKIDLPAKSDSQQARARSRRDNFYDQTVAENNARVDGNVDSLAKVRREIKFIQSELLARFGRV